MLYRVFGQCLRYLLGLRYRVKVYGAEEIKPASDGKGTLFLANHPALIDPIICLSQFIGRFKIRVLARADEIDIPIIRNLAHWLNVIELPNISKEGEQAKEGVETALKEILDALAAGENVWLYPSGRIYRRNSEALHGASGVKHILKAIPDVPIVMVRTEGLWGSWFSFAQGQPEAMAGLWRGIKTVLKNLWFFTPKRAVSITLHQPDDFPREAERDVINRYQEAYFNAVPQHNTYVSYHFTKNFTEQRPEPKPDRLDISNLPISPAIREVVYAQLQEVCGVSKINDSMELAADLHLDSLTAMELLLWAEEEFGVTDIAPETVQTVGDLLAVAAGYTLSTGEDAVEFSTTWETQAAQFMELNPKWTIQSHFCHHLETQPEKKIFFDGMSGEKSFHELALGICAVQGLIDQTQERVGIMLPAGIGANVAYLAVLLNGQVPVMLNWTVGRKNLEHACELTGLKQILTSGKLISKLNQSGQDFEFLTDRLVLLEGARPTSLMAKLKLLWRRKQALKQWQRGAQDDVAAILFTSGSEKLPKAVPLKQQHLLANIADMTQVLSFKADEVVTGILPPFHSFGLTVTLVFPVCCALRTVYHPDPTDGGKIANLIEGAKSTVFLGTPTFLNGVMRYAGKTKLRSLRIAVTGAEKCPNSLFERLHADYPQMKVLEGYGITECSPVVSVNPPEDPRPGSIGQLLPSLKARLVDADSGEPVTGNQGVLQVAGPSIFDGYLGLQTSPFVEADGERWYHTGDVVSIREGFLYFTGRLKRFVKIGGEMVSLPAIEAVLRESLENDEELALAVEAPEHDPAALTLFVNRNLDRTTANRLIREGGLAPVYQLRRIIQIDELPLLGSGKINYRALKAQLNEEC